MRVMPASSPSPTAAFADVVQRPENLQSTPYLIFSWLAYIVLRIIFPVLFIWDIAKYFLIAPLVGFAVLPAQLMGTRLSAQDKTNLIARHHDPDYQFTFGTVQTYDRVQLETVQLTKRTKPGGKPTSPAQQRYVIFLGGNGDSLRAYTMNKMRSDARACNVNVIAYNPRGVGNSTGGVWRVLDIIIDSIAQVQRLLDKGVQPQHILLKGWSLGGATAIITTAYFHRMGKPINVFADRTFASLTDTVVGIIRAMISGRGHSEDFGWKLLGWLARPIVTVLLFFLEYRMNVVGSYNTIPAANKDYCLLRSPSAERVPLASDNTKWLHYDDSIIAHYGSLHLGLKPERLAQKQRLAGPQNSAALTLFKNKNTARKMQVRHEDHNHKGIAGHNAPLGYIDSRDKTITGQDYYRSFARRALGLTPANAPSTAKFNATPAIDLASGGSLFVASKQPAGPEDGSPSNPTDLQSNDYAQATNLGSIFVSAN